MSENKKFKPGEDTVYYAQAIYDKKEIDAVTRCLEDGWLGPGKYTNEFEESVAKIFGQNFGLFVNSGSSANLLAVEALELPKGSEVITPACTFSTTVNPLIERGIVPVLIDVERDTYNTDISLIENAITNKTSAIMIPQLVGNINDMVKLREIADRHKIKLIEDSCDTIGSTLNGKPTGEYADASTTSFYASHIITAGGGGGMVMFKTKELMNDAKILRDWGRALPENIDDSSEKRFVFTLNGSPHDGKFVFNKLGHNLKPVEMQAAFGLVQLERLPEFSKVRKDNFKTLYNFFAKYEDYFILPREIPGVSTNWLAFPITLQEKIPFSRVDLMQHLENHKIQTRVLFSGNISRHPAYKDVNFRIHGDLKNSDYILSNSLLIGCHHGLNNDHINYLIDTIEKFIKAHS